MEDVVETLLGAEILDETDAVQDLRKHARERWKRRAALRKALVKGDSEEAAPPAPQLESTVH
jgi:CBS domain containing-hemolysin-like protein